MSDKRYELNMCECGNPDCHGCDDPEFSDVDYDTYE